jgi:hypothetical protein
MPIYYYRSTVRHCQIISHNTVSSTPHLWYWLDKPKLKQVKLILVCLINFSKFATSKTHNSFTLYHIAIVIFVTVRSLISPNWQNNKNGL